MGYKLKTHKGVASRFKVTASGKLKHRHELNSHLRSNRTAKKKRHLGRASILDEGHAKRYRRMLAISGLKPNKTRHERELAETESK
jgi:large subunit ribosomal protein L35